MHMRWTLPLANDQAQTVSPNKVTQNESAADAQLSYFHFYGIFARMIFSGIANAVKKYTYGQESIDLARIAIALERFRLAHGNYPESLDALAPEFMAEIPHDIIGGQPLHYRRTDDGQFVLYSVGWNETDDGGVVVLNKGSTPSVNRDEGDWVWRYPSKAE